jgi:LDH2 family malate/lactate/ureidoglycolate dehydrogenase
VCQALGGFLAGVPADPVRAERTWSGANQGSFMIAVDLAVLGDLAAFKREMDAYARRVRQLEPIAEGLRPALAGTLEWERERQYAADGIPVSAWHAAMLRKLAGELELEPPL